MFSLPSTAVLLLLLLSARTAWAQCSSNCSVTGCTGSTPFMRASVCVAQCNAGFSRTYFSAPVGCAVNQSGVCIPLNCVTRDPADCSICTQCAPNYESGRSRAFFGVCLLAAPPKITCNSISQTLPATLPTVAVSYNITFSDNTGVNGLPNCSIPSGSPFGVGNTAVKCTVYDYIAQSASCTFTVTVQDTTKPVVTCPTALYDVQLPVGQTHANVSWAAATAWDNAVGQLPAICRIGNAVVEPANTTLFPLGETIIQCTAIDPSANSASCSVRVRLTDATAPNITCPADITVQAPSNGPSLVVTWMHNATSKNPIKSNLCSPASGALFQYGPQTVTCTVTDINDKVASCAFVVTVTDVTPPQLICSAPISADPPQGASSAVVSWPLPVGIDNVGLLAPPTCFPQSGSSFELGERDVACTAVDVAGLKTACSFKLTVTDRQAPSLTCPAFGPQALMPGQSTRQVDWVVLASDNSGSVEAECSPRPQSDFGPGFHTITCFSTDPSNNTATCSSILQVIIIPAAFFGLCL